MVVELLKSFAFTGGEWVIYVLILCSILSVAVMIDRALLLSKERKQAAAARRMFEKALADGSWERLAPEIAQVPGAAANVLCAGLRGMADGVQAVEETISSAVVDEKRRVEVRMVVLNTLGNNAVYIGLFGTVLGVIKAFKDLAEESGAGPEVVMQGLSEALIATAVGLLVAIPSVIAFNVFAKQIKDLFSQTESMAHLLLARLKAGGR